MRYHRWRVNLCIALVGGASTLLCGCRGPGIRAAVECVGASAAPLPHPAAAKPLPTADRFVPPPADAFATPRSACAFLNNYLDSRVLPLWTSPRLIDTEHGGFLNSLDAEGNPLSQRSKPLLAHLRMLYVYATAIDRVHDPKKRTRLLDVYHRQFAFLIQRYWDAENDGWYFTLDMEGHPRGNDKRTLGQLYGIYVLAEIARVLDDPSARSWALKTFRRIDPSAHDERHGGYLNDWTLPADASGNAQKDTALNFHGVLGLAALARILPDRTVRARTEELIGIITDHFVYAPSGNAWLRLEADWRTPHLPPTPKDLTLYGHNAEMAWYTLEAENALRRSAAERLPWIRQAAEGVIRNGLGNAGALHVHGRLDGGPTDDRVHFWCQTEALVLLARMAAATGETRYWQLFQKTARWTFTYVAQPGVRPWKLVVTDGGKPIRAGFAGAEWRAGFHVTRMVLEVTAALARFSER